MNEAAALLQAVASIFDQLERLLGDRWLQFRTRWWALLERFEEPGADLPAAARELLLLFREEPAAYAALVGARAGSLALRAKSKSVQTMDRPPVRKTVITVFYATDRAPGSNATPAEAYGAERGSPALELGRLQVSIPFGHKRGELETPSIWRLEFRPSVEKHVVLLSVDSMDAADFVRAGRATLDAAAEKDALVFVHGFNVTFEEAARRTAQIAHDLKFGGLPLLYSWPSEGALFRYGVDETNVRWTLPHFRRFLEMVLTQFGARTVHVIAHSMGTRILAETMGAFDPGNLPPGSSKLREIVFAAPDFDADTFAELAENFRGRAERFTLYASSSDLALRVSGFLHKYQRAGAAALVVDSVDTIDASTVDTSLLGHGYIAGNRSLMRDLGDVIRGGVAADKRFELERVPAGNAHYWRFRP
jgi:esterase/lipase superfamily enzyme